MTAEPEPSATEPPIPGSPVRPVFTLPKTVALVGLMGVGKTTIGRRLADHFGLPFVDADEEIEKAAGMTIADIFANYGEKDSVTANSVSSPACWRGNRAFWPPAAARLLTHSPVKISRPRPLPSG